jgi:REP element-mobilizing transposase RayT
MSRPLRIEFPGATYHVTSRGDRREQIFADDEDRLRWLSILGATLERFEAALLAFCMMDNHFHLVLRTGRANLSQVMRQLNGVYTQAFNRRRGQVGHVFQGRFKAVLVDTDAYLMAVCRYVEANPVRAGMVGLPTDWPWSSATMHLGLAPTQPWLDTATLFGHLLGRDAVLPSDWQEARDRYADLLNEGALAPLWPQLRQQIYLGDEDFVARMQSHAGMSRAEPEVPGDTHGTRAPQSSTREVPLAQRRPPRPLEAWLSMPGDRAEVFRRAHVEGGWSLTAIARHTGLSVSWVSRLVALQPGSSPAPRARKRHRRMEGARPSEGSVGAHEAVGSRDEPERPSS